MLAAKKLFFLEFFIAQQFSVLGVDLTLEWDWNGGIGMGVGPQQHIEIMHKTLNFSVR